MTGLDRYFTFGVRDEWLGSFIHHNGGKEFWLTAGDGMVDNKKRDAFKNFTEDTGLTVYSRAADGDKYTKCIPTTFAETIIKIAEEENPSLISRATKTNSATVWSLILCNWAYSNFFNWLINNLQFEKIYLPDEINLLLSNIMENDTKGIGRRNIISALKIIMAKTPLGTEQIFADCDIEVKGSEETNNERITLKSFARCSWKSPDPRVVLYGLYKFAEKCGGYYQFTLTELLDNTIERDGVSPTQIFGLDRETMVPLLNGLSANYPELISASFSLGLDTINLHEDKTSQDVLSLF